MTQDLQQLLEKIQREGVDKARAEADRIVEQANQQAREIVSQARSEATRLLAASRQEAEAFEHRAKETIRQAARDTALAVERAVTDRLTRLLAGEVADALRQPDAVSRLALEAVRAYLSGQETVEVATTAALADALRARLAAEARDSAGITITTDDAASAGFRVRLDQGRIEHAFTGQAVTDALARQLRPRLAALMNPASHG